MNEIPKECRDLLASLQIGDNISEPALYYSSLAQSDYSVLFTSNAGELVRGTGMTDFAVPGALYLIRHGLELWLKCVLSNHRLDRLLKTIIREDDLSFEGLCAHEVMAEDSNASKSALQRALCIMRNALVDGLVYPDCQTKRISNRFANEALVYLRKHPSTPRQRLDIHYVPLIATHDLMGLWESASPYVEGLHRGAREHAHDVGGGPAIEHARLEELVIFLNHLDPDGDALRYPFSLRGEWHAHQLRLSLDAVGDLATELTESTRCFTGFRSDVYSHATVSDPSGSLYFGYYT